MGRAKPLRCLPCRGEGLPRERSSAAGACSHYEARRAVENLPRVQGNPAEIREALTNLFLNAVDAMPTGGRLTVAGYAEADPTDREAPGRVILT